MTLSNELFDPFWSTTFEVDAPDRPFGFRIGRNCPELNRLLAREAVDRWAFVTAFNPRTRRVSDAANQRAQQRLRQTIERRWRFKDGVGRPESNSLWPPEPSLLILGIAREEAIRLGRQYEQLAVVVGVAGDAPELVFCGGESSAGLPRLLYRNLGESLVFAAEDRALHIAQIHWALTSSRTWEEFRQRMPPQDLTELLRRWEEGNGQALEAGPFDAGAVPGYGDGDYPDWLQQEMEITLPDVAALGKMTSSVLNGPMVDIPTDTRETVLASLAALGYDVHEAPELDFN